MINIAKKNVKSTKKVKKYNTLTKPEFIMKLIRLDRRTASKRYIKQSNRRMIRKGHVEKLANALAEGTHFALPIAVVKKGQKWEIIDGNHRIEALNIFFKRFPTQKHDIWEMQFDSKDAMKNTELFVKLNSGAIVTIDDMIKQHEHLPAVTKLLDLKNVSVYGATDDEPVKVRILLNCLHYGKAAMSKTLTRSQIPDVLLNLGTKDVNDLDIFIKKYKTWFGELIRDNPNTSSLNMVIVSRIWFHNRNRLDDKWFEKKMEVLRQSHYWKECMQLGLGRHHISEYSEYFLKVINRGETNKARFYGSAATSTKAVPLKDGAYTKTELGVMRKELKTYFDVNRVAALLNRSYQSVLSRAVKEDILEHKTISQRA